MLNFPNSPTDGQRFTSSTGAMWKWVSASSSWQPVGSAQHRTETNFVATASQTTFTISYHPGFVDVFKNGVRLVPVTEFTATNGTTVVLVTPATVGDKITVIAPVVLETADGYTQGEIDALVTPTSRYRLSAIRYFTVPGSGTYTPPAGVRAILVEGVGGGGGGGGADGQGTGTAAMAGSGGGGGYFLKFLTSLAASYSYAVGSGGNGGSAGANNGGSGNSTTFSASGVSLTANGGLGGPGSTGGTSLAGVGGTGGSSSGGDINLEGGNGTISRVIGGARFQLSLPGRGAGPFGGMPRRSSTTAGVNGTDGQLYGGGGGGASGQVDTTGNTAGGAGAHGCIRITEYV